MRRDIRFILLLMVYAHSLVCAPLLDLDEYIQDFVRETKQIHIPGFPGAFNAAVVRWREKILMCFRVRDGNGKSTFQIGCVWLDDDFNPISEPVLLEILGDRSTFDQRQDPRLIEVGGGCILSIAILLPLMTLPLGACFWPSSRCIMRDFILKIHCAYIPLRARANAGKKIGFPSPTAACCCSHIV